MLNTWFKCGKIGRMRKGWQVLYPTMRTLRIIVISLPNLYKRPNGLYSSAEILQKFANKIIWGGLIYKRESERINTPHC